MNYHENKSEQCDQSEWMLAWKYKDYVDISNIDLISYRVLLHGSHFTGIRRSFLWALVLTSHFGALLTIDTHSLPVPVNSATHLLPERNLVPPLHDTGTECGQISYRYENRSELVPVWLVLVWHFVPVSCKRILVPEWNLYRYHVNPTSVWEHFRVDIPIHGAEHDISRYITG